MAFWKPDSELRTMFLHVAPSETRGAQRRQQSALCTFNERGAPAAVLFTSMGVFSKRIHSIKHQQWCHGGWAMVESVENIMQTALSSSLPLLHFASKCRKLIGVLFVALRHGETIVINLSCQSLEAWVSHSTWDSCPTNCSLIGVGILTCKMFKMQNAKWRPH